MALSLRRYFQRENKGLKANWYRAKTSFEGIKRLATLPREDKDACVAAYKFFQRMQAGEETKTEDETKAVAAYYKVLNNMLSIFLCRFLKPLMPYIQLKSRIKILV